jgi:hypothetical protein
MVNENGIEVSGFTIIDKTLYKIYQYKDYEEMAVSGYDMGSRIRVVKWLSKKTLIVKVPGHSTLCGARGMGMVFPFPTSYYLAEIYDEEIPKTWNCWHGYVRFTHEVKCGRKWKEGIKILENIYGERSKSSSSLE